MNKETVTVIILEGGKTCREVNRFGIKPSKPSNSQMLDLVRDYKYALNIWQKAESKLRTWEMDFTHLIEPLTKLIEAAGGTVDSVSHVNYGFETGQIKQAQIINGKAVIV
jgi:hypothetical protein